MTPCPTRDSVTTMKIAVPVFLRFGLVLALNCLVPVEAGASFLSATPQIHGTITDATSGMPIEHAVLAVRWVKQGIGGVTSTMDEMYCETDDKGVFVIPANSSIHVMSWFHGIVIAVRYPTHETMMLLLSREKMESQNREAWQCGSSTEGRVKRMVGATDVSYEIALRSLKEKFRETDYVPLSSSNTCLTEKLLANEFSDNAPRYFSQAKAIGMTVDPAETFREWEEIVVRLGNDKRLRKDFEEGKRKSLEELQPNRPVWKEDN